MGVFKYFTKKNSVTLMHAFLISLLISIWNLCFNFAKNIGLSTIFYKNAKYSFCLCLSVSNGHTQTLSRIIDSLENKWVTSATWWQKINNSFYTELCLTGMKIESITVILLVCAWQLGDECLSDIALSMR